MTVSRSIHVSTNDPSDVFKSLHTNMGLHLKPRQDGLPLVPNCHFIPQAHEVFQFHIGASAVLQNGTMNNPRDIFSFPFFNLSSCPTLSQSWRLEDRRQRWGGRNTENRHLLTMPSHHTSPVPQKPAMIHVVCTFICVYLREASQPGRGLGKTMSRSAKAPASTLLCSPTQNLLGRPGFSELPPHTGISAAHLLVASYKFP